MSVSHLDHLRVSRRFGNHRIVLASEAPYCRSGRYGLPQDRQVQARYLPLMHCAISAALFSIHTSLTSSTPQSFLLQEAYEALAPSHRQSSSASGQTQNAVSRGHMKPQPTKPQMQVNALLLTMPGNYLPKQSLNTPASDQHTSNPAANLSSDANKRKAEEINMEADSLPTAHAGHDTAAAATKIEGVFSMEEFERGFKAQHAANKAAKSSPAPGPKLGAAPVALGARSSKNTQDLNDKYQKLGIPQPVFKLEGGSDRGWKGEVSFPGLQEDLQGIKDDMVYSSKQQAKEELSGLAMVILERLEKEGMIKKVESHSIRISKYTVAVHDKAQKLGIPQPFFTFDGSTAGGWRANVSFPSLEEIQDLKDDTYHANKSKAKEAVSKRVLEVIEAAEANGMFQHFGKARGPAQQVSKEKDEPGVNYVGQLLGWTFPPALLRHCTDT